MKGFHGKDSGSQDMPHGMPEGTIKEVYSQIKEHGHGKVSHQIYEECEKTNCGLSSGKQLPAAIWNVSTAGDWMSAPSWQMMI